ncbi:putative plastid-lipid-associated protein 13, chloroplastic [Capsicum baccatum]|uniref:Plastid-lipid-associated protein 13, chloroplastic n=1 Tax=Capsicum baccatum TaxID=33114 RepID=A0A2G2VVS0_CAPBA|nr:putative plastid-lipid-associated protein 13, chloroplastic [Capsicum baccatum]
MLSSDSFFWKEAVNSEIDSILSNHTWELVDLPPGNKPLGVKWIFKRKMNTDGTIDKYKARLIVKGFKQKEDLGYFDTYSPVTRITSILMLIALAAVYGLEIHQMDVKIAFLNGELEEEIYMEQPEGFVVSGKENKVCQLIKSLYGLKQTPKQWHAKFDQTMLANGFKINECDKCVYIKDTPNHQVIVCLYVDDMLIISRDISDINATKRILESKFDMKDLGVADVILGIKIHRTPQGLALPVSLYRKGYSDANWITESNEVKSTNGYVFTTGRGAVSWKSSKQTCIARSTMESEFIALDKAGEEAEWLRNFLEDIPYWPKPMAPVCIHCDSQAAIGWARSMMYNGKSRHIRRRHNAVKELLSSEIITVDYVKSKDNVSDPLTKGLSREGVERTSKGMGLRPRTIVTGRTTDVQAIDVNERIISLERLNPTPRPTTSPYLEGLWNFEWFGTACPVFLATRLLFGQENSADIGKFIKIRSANQKWMWDCYCACENIEFEGHGFHPWKQPLAEMPGNKYNDGGMQIENKFVLSSKFSVEGPLRMKEEYVEGIFETPKVDENIVPEQLKGALDQAANTIQQLPVPIRDTVSRGLKIPLGEAFQRLIMISYLDEEILIARNTAGEPVVLTRLDPAPDPEPISDYES